MAVLGIYIVYIVDWDRFIQVLYLGRAPRTKETLPDFLKWRRVTRPPLVFRRLTGSQRTPGFWGVTKTKTLKNVAQEEGGGETLRGCSLSKNRNPNIVFNNIFKGMENGLKIGLKM